MTVGEKAPMAKVLVIDDERGPRESLRMLLNRTYRVECADSVDRGLESMKQEPPDIVIMDIRMPGKTGIEGLRDIRQVDGHVSVVMLTGYATLETAQQALRLGANDYLNKPFDTSEMMSVVGRYVQRTRFERKRSRMLLELGKMNAQLSDSLAAQERLASMGQSSAEFAHDMRNPLMIVGGYVDLLSRQLEKAKEMMGGEYTQVAEYLNVIEKNVQRCTDLSVMWQKLGKSDLSKFAPIAVSRVIDDLMQGVEPLACAEGVEVEYDVPSSDSAIHGSRPQLLRALHNVVANAVQAVEPGGGKVWLSVRDRDGQVEFAVADNGCGMTPEVRERAFEPYFTTKSENKGTGLGMSITKKIIEEHGGKVRLESELGKGTRVFLCLPMYEAADVRPSSSIKSMECAVA